MSDVVKKVKTHMKQILFKFLYINSKKVLQKQTKKMLFINFYLAFLFKTNQKKRKVKLY